MTGNGKKVSVKWAVIPACFLLVFAVAFATVFIHGGYMNKVLAKLGLRRCLKYMDTDADVVFFGDSITSGGDFNAYFPGVTVCNLGLPGDTIRGMTARAGTAAAVKPEKVFILGGINTLCDSNFDEALNDYAALLDKVCEVTDAEIYVQGVLPVSAEQEKRLFVKNTTITRFNERIAELAVERGCTYIDLPGAFMQDGAIRPEYTTEGIHLSEEGYRVWADIIAGYV